ncbi:MAG: hypothetical protein H7Z39_16250 [Burkholderiaceae bacterium]|nr:hypothetical protein [Burkholderiaceae bacterium]
MKRSFALAVMMAASGVCFSDDLTWICQDANGVEVRAAKSALVGYCWKDPSIAENPGARKPVARSKAEVRYLKQGPEKARNAVLAMLKDADSAKFRNVRSVGDGLFVCGEVNAKNSYGGYVGFKKFYFDWPDGLANIDGVDGYVEYVFSEKCNE